MSNKADRHSVYALMTHCIPASVVARSISILGRATLTTDSSTNAMVEPSTAAARTQPRSRLAQSEPSGVERMARSSHGRLLRLIKRNRSGQPWDHYLTRHLSSVFSRRRANHAMRRAHPGLHRCIAASLHRCMSRMTPFWLSCDGGLPGAVRARAALVHRPIGLSAAIDTDPGGS